MSLCCLQKSMHTFIDSLIIRRMIVSLCCQQKSMHTFIDSRIIRRMIVSLCCQQKSMHTFIDSLIIRRMIVSLCCQQKSMHTFIDSRIIRRMICESMLSTKMQKLLQCTSALVNQTALRALCFFFKQTRAHNMQVRPWSLVSILALLYDVYIYNKLVVFVSNFYVQS